MPEYANFRQQLDRVLRTQDVNQVQEFLITEKQWDAGTPSDPEFAMWIMIAGSSTLKDLHHRAGEWLMQHGHEAEALAVLGVLGADKQQQKPRSVTSKKGNASSSTLKKERQSVPTGKTHTQQRVKRTWTR